MKEYITDADRQKIARTSTCLHLPICRRQEHHIYHIRKYWYNNHHIESTLTVTQGYGVLSSHNDSGNQTDSLLGYRLNKWSSQGSESTLRSAWCSFPINIEGLILVTWRSMLDCRSVLKFEPYAPLSFELFRSGIYFPGSGTSRGMNNNFHCLQCKHFNQNDQNVFQLPL